MGVQYEGAPLEAVGSVVEHVHAVHGRASLLDALETVLHPSAVRSGAYKVQVKSLELVLG